MHDHIQLPALGLSKLTQVRTACHPLPPLHPPQAQLKAQAKTKKPERRGCWLWVNAKTLEGALDPLFLAFSLCVSLSAIAAGIFTIVRSNSFNFTINSWEDFTQVRVRVSHVFVVAPASCGVCLSCTSSGVGSCMQEVWLQV